MVSSQIRKVLTSPPVPAVMEPAVVLYLRAALPEWVVTWSDSEVTATHPDGSRVRWKYRYNSGHPAWLSGLTNAQLTAHPDLRWYETIHQSAHTPIHTRGGYPDGFDPARSQQRAEDDR